MTQLFAPLALGQHMDVVSWAAALPAIERVGLPVLLGQCGFSRAVTHIQNTAPAPPADTAATTPTRLPMPTRVAVETMSV